jgi:peptide/nickel transport system substrate-binding protein
MRVGRRAAWVAGLVVVGLSLAACTATPAPELSGSVSASASPTQATTTRTVPPPASDELAPTGWRVAARDDVVDGGTLTLAVDALPANYQLYHPDSGYFDDAVIATLDAPAFVRLEADGSWQADPDYVTSLKVTSTDPQVVELKINPKAVWSDGTSMSYRDVQANWKALSGTDPDYTPMTTAVWQDVASVERGTNDDDVLLTFARPNADWAAMFTVLYPAWAMDTPEHFDSAWRSGPFASDGTTYVSGGPFVVTAIDADAQVLTFGRNPLWWGEPAKLDTIVFRAVSRTSLGQAFANREIDAVDVHGDADVLASAEQRDDATVERALSTTIRQITLNGISGPFADPAARKAFAVAIDRSVLAQAVVGAVGAPTQLAGGLVFVPGQHGYVDQLGAELTGSADDARAILADAGYTLGEDGVAEKDGRRLVVRFVVPSDTPASASVAELVRQQTAAAGFQVDIDTVPADDYFTSYVSTQTRDFDATYFALGASAFPLANAQSMFDPADDSNNLGGVSDDSLSDLFTQANAELDPDARVQLAEQIDQTITHLFTTIPLFVEPWTWGVRADLANYGPAQFESPRWQDVGFTTD